MVGAQGKPDIAAFAWGQVSTKTSPPQSVNRGSGLLSGALEFNAVGAGMEKV